MSDNQTRQKPPLFSSKIACVGRTLLSDAFDLFRETKDNNKGNSNFNSDGQECPSYIKQDSAKRTEV